MISSLFQSTTIPVLEQVVNFTEARHTLLAGNIANIDTPGYQARDLAVDDFQTRLRTAIQEHRETPGERSPGEIADGASIALGEVSKSPRSIMLHDKSNVGMENQVTEMVKNQMQHNMALSLMIKQFHLLEAAIRGQV